MQNVQFWTRSSRQQTLFCAKRTTERFYVISVTVWECRCRKVHVITFFQSDEDLQWVEGTMSLGQVIARLHEESSSGRDTRLSADHAPLLTLDDNLSGNYKNGA